jgi:heme/copper-type cytochrome/quinol oxidase subunit 2
MQVKKQTLTVWVTGFVVVISIFFLFLVISSKNSNSSDNQTLNNSSNRVIDIQASSYKFNTDTIKIKQGEKITLNIDNLDLSHGIVIPELNLYGMDTIEINATQKGTFDFYCANPHCGAGHNEMVGQIVIE